MDIIAKLRMFLLVMMASLAELGNRGESLVRGIVGIYVVLTILNAFNILPFDTAVQSLWGVIGIVIIAAYLSQVSG